MTIYEKIQAEFVPELIVGMKLPLAAELIYNKLLEQKEEIEWLKRDVCELEEGEYL